MFVPVTFGILCLVFGSLNVVVGDAWTAIIFLFIGAWCIYYACSEKEEKKSNKDKDTSYHKMSDDDKWLEENSWVWSDPNYNGKRNRKK